MEIRALDIWNRVDELNKTTLVELAKQIKIPYTRIKRNRTDCRIPSAEDLYKISQAFNVPMEYLLTGKYNNNIISPEAQFVESNQEMRTLVRYCMNDGRLLSALQLIVEQARIEGEGKIHA